MSNTSFLARMGIAKMGHIGDSITSALINFDPETASKAQIDEYAAKTNEIEHRVAKAEEAVNAANVSVSALQVKLERDRTAAKALRQSMSATTDQAISTKLTIQATAIIAQMKQIGGDEMTGEKSGDLFTARADLAQAQSDLTEWQNVHQQAVQTLTSAQSALKHARDDIDRAQHDKERAELRSQQADADAQLKSGLSSTGGIAIAAMQQNAAKMREDARAAQLHSDALKSASGGDADAIVAETLAGAKPASSVLDDLDKL